MAFWTREQVAARKAERAAETPGSPVLGEWPDAGVTFDVVRGVFDVPPEVMQRAEITGDDFEIRRAFARALSRIDEARPYRYERVRGGLRVYWRSIRVVAA